MTSLALEQTAIAEILSDMDAEIRAVEEKLSKARAVKAGMMSELFWRAGAVGVMSLRGDK